MDSNVILDKEQLLDSEEQEALFRKWIISGDPDKPAWLERELKASDHKFKIIAMHHPPVSFGRHRKDWDKTSSGYDLKSKRKQLLDLFYDSGVQLVFACHEHSYEHSIVRLLRGGKPSEGVIHVVVTGGGGAPLRKITDEKTLGEHLEYYRNEGFHISVRQEKIYHYCVVRISPNEISIDVMKVPRDTKKARCVEEIVITSNIAP